MLLIKEGRIWYKNKWFNGDILIKDSIVKRINENINIDDYNCKVIEAKGNIVIPGLIDIHVHLREPGYEHKETIETGLKAAVKGGFTTVVAMPNTKPAIDNPNLLKLIIEKANKLKLARLLQNSTITIGGEGKELVDFEAMKKNGAIGFSDDGFGIQSSQIMKRAMEDAKRIDSKIIAHCEDESLTNNGIFHDGQVAKKFNLSGIPPESEYIQIARDLLLAKITGVHYHICHISTKESVELIRQAKVEGINVTAEVTPHHLILTEKDVMEPLANYKMNPPLRSEEDRKELLEGLIDGAIDVVATDHAPHTEDEKNKDLYTAPFGIIGLEIAFPLLYTKLVRTNILKLERLIEVMTLKPAEFLNISNGNIEIGQPADITIIDLDNNKKVIKEDLQSKGKNTPFLNHNLYGWPKHTIVNGEIVWSEEGGF